MNIKADSAVKFIALYVIVLFFGLSKNSAAVGVTELASVDTSGIQGNNVSYQSTLSQDGRYVAFASDATNLVGNDSNRLTDIFVHDRQTGQTTRDNVSSNGEQANNYSETPVISADGRFVAFVSAASNLVSENSAFNGIHYFNIYVRDRQTHQTRLVSKGIDTNGQPGGCNQHCDHPQISADGHIITFVSGAWNLGDGKPYTAIGIYAFDLQTNKLQRVDVNAGAQSISSNPRISADGRFIAYSSYSWTTYTSTPTQAYLYDLSTQQITTIDFSFGSLQNDLFVQDITPDGRFILLTNPSWWDFTTKTVAQDFYVYDRTNQQMQNVNAVYNGSPLLGITDNGHTISPDGRYIGAYTAGYSAYNLYSYMGTYLIDKLSGAAELISPPTNGNVGFGYYTVSAPKFSADGRYYTFASNSPDLVAGDTNHTFDVFVRDTLLNTASQANLTVAVSQKPVSILPNDQGVFTYTATNIGPNPVAKVNLLHLTGNGVATQLKPSQGQCRRYSTISLCKLGSLPVGGKLTFQVTAKAKDSVLRQKVVVSASPIDAKPANNSVTINTIVKP